MAYRLVSHLSLPSTILVKMSGGPLRRPRHVAGLPRFRASSRKSYSGFTSHPVTVPPGSGPLWEERGGRRCFKPISSELVRHMSAGVHFSRFATPEMLCAWLGPCTHATRSNEVGALRVNAHPGSWPLASSMMLMHLSVAKLTISGCLYVWLSPQSLIAPSVSATNCLLPAWRGPLHEGEAVHHDRPIRADKRAVIPILQVCSSRICICNCR